MTFLRPFLLSLIILTPVYIMIILTNWRIIDVIIGICVFFLAFDYIHSRIKPKPSGYAILHETYVELYLHKTLHLIKYHELTFVRIMGTGRGGTSNRC